jgi:hypothetical protein
MREILSWIMSVAYSIVCLTVVARALLLLISYLKSAPDARRKNLSALGLSVLAECGWCALVTLSFSISHVDLIPLVLAILGLVALRRIAPFERLASQHVYSLLVSLLPGKKETLTKATALHLF